MRRSALLLMSGLALIWGSNFLWMKLGVRAMSAEELTLLALAVAATGFTAVHLTGVAVGSVLVLGVIGTGIAYLLAYVIITREGATVASTVTYLNPIVAIVLGVAVLSETITVPVLAGIALVLAGQALTRYRR